MSLKQLEEVNLPLNLYLKKVRFRENIEYSKPNCNTIFGVKDTGKSSLNENLATHYAERENAKILDLFGSRDNEGLGWCRSPYKDSILFVTGDSVDVSCSWNTIKLSKLKLSDIEKYKVLISVSAFYSKLKEEHIGIKLLMDLFWTRTHWTDVWYMLIRETANLIYSRISVGEDQTKAKAYVIYVLREARHMGYAVGADAIRYMGIDIDLRSLADYTFIKACGQLGLPDQMRFLYRYFNPYSVMRMPKDAFALVSKTGTIWKGYFEYPYWHKKEKENLLSDLGIQLEYGEQIDYGDKGQVSDFEHEEIIRLRKSGVSQIKVAEQKKRSSRTIWSNTDKHNKDIDSLGYCERCKRLKSPLQTEKV